jgi:hypothetical protein
LRIGADFSAGALCCAPGAGDGACAKATPPAIIAAVATDISKVFLMFCMMRKILGYLCVDTISIVRKPENDHLVPGNQVWDEVLLKY